MKIDKLTENSNKNIEFVFHHYKLIEKTITNNYFIKLLYSLIDKSRDLQVKHTIKEVEKQPNIDIDSPFLSKEIKNTILQTRYKCFTISIRMEDSQFTIELFTKDRINIKRFIYYIKTVLKLCFKNAITKEKEYHFKFILTDASKTKPVKCVYPDNINSGYTVNHQEVVIFRKEELLKVFIHECFHLFCLDFSTHDIDYKQMFEPLFHIKSDFLLFETLCEFWSRTLNVALLSYYMQPNTSYKEFEHNFIVNLNLERVYSMIQMSNYLACFQLTYDDLLKGNVKKYSETTNGFCYYVLTPVLLYNYQTTINWFISHNETLLQFSKKERDIYLFYQYVKAIYKNKDFLEYIREIQVHRMDTMMMSVFDINIF
jgi:hypothetical protein